MTSGAKYKTVIEQLSSFAIIIKTKINKKRWNGAKQICQFDGELIWQKIMHD
jgi:hypothetical protein